SRVDRQPHPLKPNKDPFVTNPIPSKSFRKLLTTVVKYLLALGLLVVVVALNWEPSNGGKGLHYVWQEHVLTGNIHWEYLALAGVICAVSTLLTFVRWYFLVRAVGLPFRVADALRLGMIGFYFNTFLPGSVGGDILKAAFLAREQSRRTVAVATVIMDRILGLWALFWFVALLGGVCWMAGLVPPSAQPGCRWLMLVASATVGFGVLAWGALGFLPDGRAERFAERLGRLPRVGGAAAEFWRAVWMYRRRQVWVVLSLLMSMVGFTGFVLVYYFSVLTLFDA